MKSIYWIRKFLVLGSLFCLACGKMPSDTVNQNEGKLRPPFALRNVSPPFDTINFENDSFGLYLNGWSNYYFRYSLNKDSISFKPFYFKDLRFVWSTLGSELKLKADSVELKYKKLDCMGFRKNELMGLWRGEIRTYTNSFQDSIRTLLMPASPLNLEVKEDTIRFWNKVEDYKFEWNTSCVGSIIYDKHKARRVFRFKFLAEDSLVLINLKGTGNRELVFSKL